ncbi:MAG: hypothetical protein OCD01_03990 [Fibrobacterales bacterium]
METYTIKPNWGVNSIGFESSKSDIKKTLGEPQEVEHDEESGYYYSWFYHRNRMSFEFWKENNYEISAIDIWSSDVIVFDQVIPYKHHIMLVRNIIHSNVEISDLQEEDQGDFYEIMIRSLNIVFTFEESLFIGMRLLRPEPSYDDYFDDFE